MNNDETQEKPSDSKCFKCRYGMVIEETETQSVFEPGIEEGNGFESEPSEPSMRELSFPVTRVRSICMRDTNIPVVFSLVKSCNRFSAQ